MKKTIFTLASLALGLTAMAQSHQLSGQINGLEGGKLVVRLVNEANTDYEKTDTLMTSNGTFTYDVDGLKGCRRVFLSDAPTAEGARATRVSLYLVEGENLIVNGTLGNLTEEGSKFYQDKKAGEAALKSYNDKLQALTEEYQTKSEVPGADKDKIREEIMKQVNAVANDMEDAAKSYIKSHADEDASVLMCLDLKDAREGFSMVSNQVKNGKMKSFMDTLTAQLEAQDARDAQRKEAEKMLQPGMPAPEITLNDLDGKPFSLSQLKGKYVIIDWWGSWCIWCIRGIPKMKEYYAKYSDKLEILGVDCNDTEDKWKDAVKKYELPWKHVYMPRDSKLTATYAIQGYPTKCIINPDGTINKIIVGEDPKFYDYLDELLK